MNPFRDWLRPARSGRSSENLTHQLTNLAGRPDFNIQRALLEQKLERWMKETHDSVPKEISHDSFDRETGDALKLKDYRRTTPGEDKGASSTNAPGPR